MSLNQEEIVVLVSVNKLVISMALSTPSPVCNTSGTIICPEFSPPIDKLLLNSSLAIYLSPTGVSITLIPFSYNL